MRVSRSRADIPIYSVNELKDNPNKIFEVAHEEKSGAYIFDNDEILGVVLTLEQYENIIDERNRLQNECQ